MDVNQLISNIPIVTKSLIIINVFVYLLTYITSSNINNYSINSYNIIYNYELYRMITSAFMHGGLMHIAMNMMSLYQLGSELEIQFGSLSMIFITIWTIFLSGFCYIFLQWLIAVTTGLRGYMGISAVGYSCVLFTYAVIEAFHTNQSSRSVFGMFNVPSKVYPFILLIILQVMLPNISFIGHLSGVIVGLLTITGVVDYLIPSSDGLLYIEQSNYLLFLTRNNNYIRHTNKSYVNAATSSIYHSINHAISYVFNIITNILTTLLFIIGCPVDRISNTFTNIFTIVSSSLYYIICCGWYVSNRTVTEPFQGPARTLTNRSTTNRNNRNYQSLPNSDIEEGIQLNTKNGNQLVNDNIDTTSTLK